MEHVCDADHFAIDAFCTSIGTDQWIKITNEHYILINLIDFA